MRIGALYLPQRECVLDVGVRADRHGTRCRDNCSTSCGARYTPQMQFIRTRQRGALPLFSTLPTSRTHSRPNRRIGALYLPQAAHVMRPTTSIYVWDRRILCAFLHADTQLEQRAPDALGTPQAVVPGHPHDQGDRLRRHARRPLRRARPRRPEEAEPLAMPAQHGVGLDDQQGRSSRARPASEDNEEEAVERRRARAGDLTIEDDELLAQECILGD